MIAAALLGKEVEYAASSYHKVPAIAEYALADYPVRRLQSRGDGEGEWERRGGGGGRGAPRVQKGENKGVAR